MRFSVEAEWRKASISRCGSGVRAAAYYTVSVALLGAATVGLALAVTERDLDGSPAFVSLATVPSVTIDLDDAAQVRAFIEDHLVTGFC